MYLLYSHLYNYYTFTIGGDGDNSIYSVPQTWNSHTFLSPKNYLKSPTSPLKCTRNTDFSPKTHLLSSPNPPEMTYFPPQKQPNSPNFHLKDAARAPKDPGPGPEPMFFLRKTNDLSLPRIHLLATWNHKITTRFPQKSHPKPPDSHLKTIPNHILFT